ncbi:hypothetical protein [Ectopseudomonas alcaliphila]|uniref:Transposase n=1 Tax=Ectopseudomonas alcaliphila TaxID=101564 RepID=A0ABU4PYE6_9GAMM|nr:hypothetical protein [Pseudomonas alcaliphila]MDX5992628.1 hypothetical protein [Pseudomonas alcaliphila]PKM27760.1 MAG: hypothetical protein CVV08_22475 [Gammaproteobacteria bacterium HGW-Gammaproteobacteria-12]
MGFETLPEGLESGLQHGKTVVTHQQVATTQRAVFATSRVRCSVPECHTRIPQQSVRQPRNSANTHTGIRGLTQLIYASTMRAQLCQRELDAD